MEQASALECGGLSSTAMQRRRAEEGTRGRVTLLVARLDWRKLTIVVTSKKQKVKNPVRRSARISEVFIYLEIRNKILFST